MIGCNTQSGVWLGHLKLEIPRRHQRGHVKHVTGDEVRLGDIKLECTSVSREFTDTFPEESPRQQGYTEKEEA